MKQAGFHYQETMSEPVMRTHGLWFVLLFVLALPLPRAANAAELRLPRPSLPNNVPIPNEYGAAATFSETGYVNRTDDFHTAHGTNGRDCASCHAAEVGWSVTPAYVTARFIATGGRDPLFNKLDANNPTLDLSTVWKRKEGYSMLLRGLFRRGGAMRDDRDFDIVAVNDPNGVGSTTVFSFYRRPLPTANLKLATGVHWDGRFSVTGDGRPPRLGLFQQARAALFGALERPREPPPPDSRVDAIVDDEVGLWHAQVLVPGIGRLDSCGGRGGPEALSLESTRVGRFDLYDAWLEFVPGSCDPRPSAAALRAQIARGQEIFNTRRSATGGTCLGCHNVANNGTNSDDRFFDIGVSSAANRPSGMPLYTVRKRCAAGDSACVIEEKQTTDPGRAFITGRFADINKFKVPSVRGVAARAPYFHNGSAKTLRDVVRHYGQQRGFNFTKQEEADLVAFLRAL
jgi:cytochrome c peroxidase